MIGTISIKNISENGIAFFPGPVNVKIGGTLAVHIEEAFKIQIQFNRADVRDAQTITHDTVSTTAPTNVQKALTRAVLNDIPSD